MPLQPAIVLVALGSNLDDPGLLIRNALEQLSKLCGRALVKSSLWQSAPVDCPPGSPPFINAAVAFEPPADETPESLLRKLQSLEREFGRRTKKVLNEPRSLDLDLIAFGTEVRSTPALMLPHPRAHLRRFVLAPLAEVAPEFVLPGRRKTIRQLLASLPADPSVKRLPA